jgi:hypothetical protein
MTSDEWGAICLLLDKGFKWREPFGKAQSSAYRMLLEGYSAEQLMTVIRALVARGQVFGPTPGEIVAEIRCDPSRPTFVEAYALIYGKGGILRARSAESTFGDEGERGRAYRAAQRARAAGMHPLVASFVDRYGLDRLEVLPLNDPEFGDAKRRELERSWDDHVEAMEGRDVRALASGRRGEGLARLDPLSALDLTPEARRLGIGSTP